MMEQLSRRKTPDPVRVAAYVRQAIRWPLMIKRPAFRFTLLTLLLVVTLAAVSVSHVLTSWELASSREELRAARREANVARGQLLVQANVIRHAKDELGRLTIKDKSMVHVISASPYWRDGSFDPDRPPLNLCWNLHLPKGSRWKVRWATRQIPAAGFPDSDLGGFELIADSGQWAYLAAQFLNSPQWDFLISVPNWELLVSDHTDIRDHSHLDNEESRWLKKGTAVSWEGPGGDQNASPHTVVLSPDQAIVLQLVRLKNDEGASDDNTKPCDGFMIWIEPWQP
jgi:hypothetical protein